MLVVLRIIGVFNAVIWLGSGLFFTFGVAPGVFSREMKDIFGDYYTGIIAQHLIGKYFTVNLVCCIVALAHFFAEMIYMGKPFRRLTFALLIGVLSLGLLGGYLFTPKLKEVHQTKYLGKPEERPGAAQQFSRLHAVSSTLNLISLIGLVFYTWQVTNPSDHMRFLSSQKFRG